MTPAARPGGLDPRWWQRSGLDLAREVYSIATALEADHTWRRIRYLKSLSIYEGQPLQGLYASAYVGDATGHGGGGYADADLTQLHAEFDELTYNLSRSACDTVQANIAGAQKPKPMFMTSGADWETMRKAQKLDKFVEAQLHNSQGRYLNAWELMEDVFLDATIWGVGAVQCFADVDAEKVALERVYPFELFVDSVEAYHGDPQNLFRVRPIDKDKLIEMFCSEDEPESDQPGDESESGEHKVTNAEKRAAIEGASTCEPTIYGSGARVAQAVKVVEAWRLPVSESKPGKHVFAIDGMILHEEEWTDPEFPFVFIRWAKDRIGFWGKSLVEEGESVAYEVNELAAKLQSRVRVCAGRRTFVPNGANIKEEALQENEDEVIIYYDGAQPPTTSDPEPVTAGEVQWLQANIQRFYEFLGVPQSQAEGQKPKGVESGTAIRTVNDLGARRFSVKAKAYEDSFVALGRQIVRRTRELATQKPDLVARWPGKRFLNEIPWGDVDLAEDMYLIQVAPASALPNDPAGRLSTVQEMIGAGMVSQQTGKRLLGWPDIEKDAESENEEYAYVEELIEKYLDVRNESEQREVYEAPEGYLTNKEGAVVQFGRAYFRAKRQRAPEMNLEILRRYMQQLDELIARAAPPPANAPPMGPPGMGVPPALPPGMPPGAPPGQPLPMVA